MPVNSGDLLVITQSSEDSKARVTVNWSQGWSSRSETYFLLVAQNKSQSNSEVTLFVQENWFNDQHLGSKQGDGSREVRVDGQFQYGQRNGQGEGRFVVLHDKEHKPYQHRFMETAFGSNIGNLAAKLAKSLQFPGDEVHNIAKSFVGDYLHTF